jgi:hypothetical protein
MVADAYNPSPRKVKAGGLQVPFKASLIYIVSSRPACATGQDLVSKKSRAREVAQWYSTYARALI